MCYMWYKSTINVSTSWFPTVLMYYGVNAKCSYSGPARLISCCKPGGRWGRGFDSFFCHLTLLHHCFSWGWGGGGGGYNPTWSLKIYATPKGVILELFWCEIAYSFNYFGLKLWIVFGRTVRMWRKKDVFLLWFKVRSDIRIRYEYSHNWSEII